MNSVAQTFFQVMGRCCPRIAVAMLICTATAVFSLPSTCFAQGCFVRGDVNGDGVIDMVDVNDLQNIVFFCGGPPCSACDDAGDVDDDGFLTPNDVALLLNYVNFGVPIPPPPFPFCGVDPTPDPLFCSRARGDLNWDGSGTPADVVLLLNCVFLGSGNCGPCYADVNSDGSLSPADVVLELNAVFLGMPPIPFPC